MIPRHYSNLESYLQPGKVLALFGPRQVGKTTLINQYLQKTSYSYRFDSGDNIELHEILGSQKFSQILNYAEGYQLIVLDEAQRIPNIGMGLKILVDQMPQLRILVTGSASFELAGQIGEPLTGRKRSLELLPIAQLELLQSQSPFDLQQSLESTLVFGSYPAVLTASTEQQKRTLLKEIVNSYLLKDILEIATVKSSKVLLDILKLLAFQVGNQVSLSEIATVVGLDYKTVARYLDLLEKAFVIFELRGYSRNLRKEITQKSKYFFLDTGVRNTIINNFNPLSIRDDVGKLWENFFVVERRKYQNYTPVYSSNYFWRTWNGQEIDWVEERDGGLYGYECTYSNAKKKKAPPLWITTYPEASFVVVHHKNYLEFVT